MMDLICGRGRSLSCGREPSEAAVEGDGPGGCADTGAGESRASLKEIGDRRVGMKPGGMGGGRGRGRGNAVLAIGVAALPSRRLGLGRSGGGNSIL
jgi:hypothetical protein